MIKSVLPNTTHDYTLCLKMQMKKERNRKESNARIEELLKNEKIKERLIIKKLSNKFM